jgi:hypothetical protein
MQVTGITDTRPPLYPEPETPLEWALYYATRGCLVFPIFEVAQGSDGTLTCACKSGSECRDAGKHPRIEHGFHGASKDEVQIRQWWKQWPGANIGIRTGDGTLVLDVDVDKGGGESLELLELTHGKLPPTRQALTGSGGCHQWFRLPEGVQLGCFNGFEYGLDIRCDGGYVAAPPSIHKSGRHYLWDGLAGFDEPVAEIPQWLLNLLLTRRVKNGAGEPWRQIEISVNSQPEVPQAWLDCIEHDSALSSLWNLRRADFANPVTGEPNFSSYDLALGVCRR